MDRQIPFEARQLWDLPVYDTDGALLGKVEAIGLLRGGRVHKLGLARPGQRLSFHRIADFRLREGGLVLISPDPPDGNQKRRTSEENRQGGTS